MNKKLIAIIVGAAVVIIAALTVWLVTLFGGEAEKGAAKISVGEATASVGKTVKVPVELSENPGIVGINIAFNYDTEKLEYISVEKGKIINDCEAFEKDGKISVLTLEDEDFKTNGTLYYLTFKVRDGAKGNAEVEAICEDNSVCNYDEELIKVTSENGKVIIK